MAGLSNAVSAFEGLSQRASSLIPGADATAAGSPERKAVVANWRKSLKPSSFRGVQFFVASRDQEGGRRAVTHEFAGRDIPFTEDLGRKARTYTVEGYVMGKDYMPARDALVAACEAAGPAPLIVPWAAETKVECGTYRLRESQEEGGIAHFSLTFVEAGEAAAPTGTPMPGVLTGGKVDDAMEVIGKVLDSTIKVGGVPLPVPADTLAAIKDLGAQISGVSSLVRMGADIPGALKMLQAISPADLVGLLPSELCGPLFSLAGAYSSLTSAFATAHTSRSTALLALASSTPVVTVPAGAGLVRTVQAENRAAIAQYQRSAAVAEAARSAVYSQPASRQEAIALRDELVDAIDTVLETTRDQAVYTAYADLRTTTVSALTEVSGSAPEVTTVTSAAVLPSLVLAQRVRPYVDTTDEEAQILARNKVRHPGFVPPGTLEVLRG